MKLDVCYDYNTGFDNQQACLEISVDTRLNLYGVRQNITYPLLSSLVDIRRGAAVGLT